MGGDFLLAAQLLGNAAIRAGCSAQVRTPGWPSPPGSPDRALVRLNPSPLMDTEIPSRFDIEVVCDPTLAVIPPMGNALIPEGLLLVNAAAPFAFPDGGPRGISADLGALSQSLGVPLGFALAGAAWAALDEIAPEMALPEECLEQAMTDSPEPPTGKSERELLRAASRLVSELLAGKQTESP